MLQISQVANQPVVTISAAWTDPPPTPATGWTVASRKIDFFAGSTTTGTPVFTAPATALTSPAQLLVPTLPAGSVTAKLTVVYASALSPAVTQTQTDTSNTITIVLPAGGGGGLPPGVVSVPPLDTDLAAYSTALASATRLAARAAGPATKFRSAYLKKQAI
jgi:hypothetical protein